MGNVIEYIESIRMECKLVHPNAKLPHRKRDTDAAYDIYSVEDAIVPAHGIKNVNTGIIVTAPSGYYITMEARSSMGKEGIIPMRGIIDSGYNGPLMALLTNQTNDDYKVHAGDRIAQIILHKQYHMLFDIVEEFSDDYCHRGEAGWGSSGK